MIWVRELDSYSLVWMRLEREPVAMSFDRGLGLQEPFRINFHPFLL